MSGEKTDWNEYACTDGASTADTPDIEQALEAAKEIAEKFKNLVTGVVLNPADYKEAVATMPKEVVPSINFGGFGSLGMLGGLRVFSDERIPAGRMLELHGNENVDQAMEPGKNDP